MVGQPAGADVAARIQWALDLVAGRDPAAAAEIVHRLVGVGVATQESVPAALAVASMFPGDTWAACRYAASLGGDCDTIAAMAGAVVGARMAVERGSAFVRRVFLLVVAVLVVTLAARLAVS